MIVKMIGTVGFVVAEMIGTVMKSVKYEGEVCACRGYSSCIEAVVYDSG
jgi:hypothetical protein